MGVGCSCVCEHGVGLLTVPLYLPSHNRLSQSPSSPLPINLSLSCCFSGLCQDNQGILARRGGARAKSACQLSPALHPECALQY